MSPQLALTAFQFTVALHGAPDGADSSFSAIDGLKIERQAEELREGGENRLTHRLPAGIAAHRLSFKRWITPSPSAFRTWALAQLASDFSHPIKTLDFDIRQLDAHGRIAGQWCVERAWPVSMHVDALNAQNNALALETFEIACGRLTREYFPGQQLLEQALGY